jgi:acyl carrier protein
MMTTEEFLNELCSIFGRDEFSLSMSDTKESVLEWDSLGHLSIISLLHEKFPLTGDEEGLKDFDSIQELVVRLRELGFISV